MPWHGRRVTPWSHAPAAGGPTTGVRMKRLVRATFLSAALAVFAGHASLASAQATPPADAWRVTAPAELAQHETCACAWCDGRVTERACSAGIAHVVGGPRTADACAATQAGAGARHDGVDD